MDIIRRLRRMSDSDNSSSCDSSLLFHKVQQTSSNCRYVSTRSPFVLTISRPPTSSSLKNINRSFRHAAPRLWNILPHFFREPHPHPGFSPSHYPTQVGSTLSSPSLSPSITPALFHSRLKTLLFLSSLTTIDFSIDTCTCTHWTDLTDSGPDRFLLLIGFVLVLVLG